MAEDWEFQPKNRTRTAVTRGDIKRSHRNVLDWMRGVVADRKGAMQKADVRDQEDLHDPSGQTTSQSCPPAGRMSSVRTRANRAPETYSDPQPALMRDDDRLDDLTSAIVEMLEDAEGTPFYEESMALLNDERNELPVQQHRTPSPDHLPHHLIDPIGAPQPKIGLGGKVYQHTQERTLKDAIEAAWGEQPSDASEPQGSSSAAHVLRDLEDRITAITPTDRRRR